MIQRRGFLGAMLALASAPTIAGYRPTQLGRAISRGRYVSVLDFGAGTGIYSYAYDQLGFDVKVFEIWDAHKEYIKEKIELTPDKNAIKKAIESGSDIPGALLVTKQNLQIK